jgi:hypothetical protein
MVDAFAHVERVQLNGGLANGLVVDGARWLMKDKPPIIITWRGQTYTLRGRWDGVLQYRFIENGG